MWLVLVLSRRVERHLQVRCDVDQDLARAHRVPLVVERIKAFLHLLVDEIVRALSVVEGTIETRRVHVTSIHGLLVVLIVFAQDLQVVLLVAGVPG